MDSPNLEVVKNTWNALARDGMCAGLEAILRHCHADVELRPYSTPRPRSFEESGDDVIVAGSIRVRRPGGSIADAQLRWTYGFRDGLIRHAEFAPLAAAVSR